MEYILAIDQGTSSTKAIVLSDDGREIASATAPLHTVYTPQGTAEQDPEAIVSSVLDAVGTCVTNLEAGGTPRTAISCAGIAVQRETFVLWDTSGPVCPAVVWQCKRSVDICTELKAAGYEADVRARSGLILDPYFSASKITWLLRNEPAVRAAYDSGSLHMGTIDSWLLHRLTGATVHATDRTNASRTLLYNIHTGEWDAELARVFGTSSLRMASIHPSAHHFGESNFGGLFSRPVPITALAGDSHAALFGERCFAPGQAKVTLGTGSSILINAGTTAPEVYPSAMSAVGFGLPGRTTFALEGIIISAGSVLTWLQQNLELYTESELLAGIARSVPDTGGVQLIPGHAGLGAPFWKMNARGAISGLSFGTTKAHILRAALESIPYQIRAILDAIAQESGVHCRSIQANGGISRNDFVVSWLASTLGVPVHTAATADVTARGIAFLAGIGAGIYSGPEQIAALHIPESIHEPSEAAAAQSGYAQWRREVDRAVDQAIEETYVGG